MINVKTTFFVSNLTAQIQVVCGQNSNLCWAMTNVWEIKFMGDDIKNSGIYFGHFGWWNIILSLGLSFRKSDHNILVTRTYQIYVLEHFSLWLSLN